MFILMLLVGVFPGMVGITALYFVANRLVMQSAGPGLIGTAEKAASGVDTIFQYEISHATQLSRLISIRELTKKANEHRREKGKGNVPVDSMLSAGRLQLFNSLLETETSLFLDTVNAGPYGYCHAMIIDDKGEMVSSSTASVPKISYKNEKWWQESMKGRPFVGSSTNICGAEKGHNNFYFTVPILNPETNLPIGTLYLERHADSVFASNNNFRFGDTGHLEIVDVKAAAYVIEALGRENEPLPDWLIREISLKEKGWTVGIDEHGRKSASAFAPVKISDWHVVLSQEMDEIYAPMKSLLWGAAAPGFLTVLILATIWFNISRKMILTPISKLSDGASEIGHGNLGYRLDIKTGDELENLSHEFNTMAENLSTSQEKLRRWNDDLREEVSRRTSEFEEANDKLKANKEELQGSLHQVMMLNDELQSNKEELRKRNDELAGANLRLREVDRLKSEFLANMSHELRTPLTAIIGFSELLADGAMGDMSEEQTGCVEDILTSGQHLLKLINNILDLSKIEAGKMELHSELFSMGKVISFIKKTTASLIEKKKQILRIEIAEGLPDIYADPGKIKQLLLNLVGNAIKFTAEGGTITIGVDFKNNCFEISVKDTGIGIKPEDMERIFQEFQQVEGSTSREYEGTGLGLALTRKLTEMHSGKLELESEAGKGSKFTAYIPLVLEKRGPLRNEEIRPAEEPAVIKDKPERDDSQPLILVVEDDPKLSRLLSVYLTQAGYRIEVAMDGDEALKKAIELKPFAITLDIMLSKKDGWEVLQELSAMPETRDIPVIIVSMVDNQELGFSLGALDYLVKPVSREALLESLEGYVSKARIKKGVINVLAVDDDLKTLEFLSTILKKEGYHVSLASGGNEGLALAFENLPDIIILDLMMPKISGFDVIRELKKHPGAKEIPILILTAKDLSKEEKNDLLEDVAKVVRKGEFSKDDLVDEIKRIRHWKE